MALCEDRRETRDSTGKGLAMAAKKRRRRPEDEGLRVYLKMDDATRTANRLNSELPLDTPPHRRFTVFYALLPPTLTLPDGSRFGELQLAEAGRRFLFIVGWSAADAAYRAVRYLGVDCFKLTGSFERALRILELDKFGSQLPAEVLDMVRKAQKAR